jgi:tetratricopeptide (TPR) repeat protein
MALPAAALYEGMGEWNVYHEAYPAALENYDKALELKIASLDPHSPAIGKTLEHIAWALVELARYSEAISACQKAETIQRSLTGMELLDLAKTLNTKGLTLHRQGRSAEGLKCHQEALKIRLDNLGVSSSDIEKNLYQVTKAVNAKGREVGKLRKRSPTSAAELLEQIVDVASSFNNISRCYNGMNLLPEALAFSEKTVEIYAANCGQHHPLTIWAMQRKAYVLTCLEKHAEALKIYQETHSLTLAIRGKDHADFAYTLEGMGWCYFHLGNFKQAIQVFKEALRVGLEPLGEDAVGMIRAHNGIGWSYLKEGNVEEGLKFVTKHLQMCAKVYPHTPKLEAEIVSFQKALNTALASKNHREAIAQAAKVGTQISQEMLGQEHPVTQSLSNISRKN